MTSRAPRVAALPLLPLLAVLSLLASACSGSTDGSTTTPPMLAAAVAAHTDAPVRAAAAIGVREEPEMLGEGDVAVEVALDRDVGDNAHVRVAVTTGTPFGASPARRSTGPRCCSRTALPSPTRASPTRGWSATG